jgi:hypothetical protein
MVTVNHIQFPIDLSEFSPDAPIAGLHAILHVPSIHPRPIRGEVTAGAVRQFSTRQSGDDRRLRPSVCSTSPVETSRAASTTRSPVVANAAR